MRRSLYLFVFYWNKRACGGIELAAWHDTGWAPSIKRKILIKCTLASRCKRDDVKKQFCKFKRNWFRADFDSKCDNPTLTNQPTHNKPSCWVLSLLVPALLQPMMGTHPGHLAHHSVSKGSSQPFGWLQPQRMGEESWGQGAQVGTFAWGVAPNPVWLLNLITEDLGESDAPHPGEVQ